MNNLKLTIETSRMASADIYSQPARQQIRQTIRQWYQNWRTRRALQELDSTQLKDIGISRSEAAEEVAKPFWR